MIPKKIYLNYVDEDDLDKTLSEEPISDCDCYMQNREYTDLSQVWHDVSEIPTKEALILYRTTLCRYDVIFQSGNKEGIWKVFVKDYGVSEWAYVNELRPKGGKK